MSLDDISVSLIHSVDDAAELMRWLSIVQGPLAVDTETTGLNRETDHVRLVQVGDGTRGWAIPFDRWGGVFEDIARRWTGRYTMHNAPFDWRMLKSADVDIPQHRIDDTRFAAHVLEPTKSTALKNIASRLVDRRAAAMARRLDEWVGKSGKWSWATVPIVPDGPAAIYWQYGALDPVLTRQVHDILVPRVQAEAPLAYTLELAVSWVVEKMERRGVKIDRPFVEEHHEKFGQYVREAETWCLQNYGVKPGANADVVRVLSSFGHEFTELTKTGAYVLDKTILGGIDHPLAQVVLKRRQVQKIQSTFLRRFLEYSERDGRVHPNINTIGGSGKTAGESGGEYGVRTSRMSIDSPNFQQLSRAGTNPEADTVRDSVISTDEDFILLSCDFDQIEMRGMAHLSRDEGMRTAFLTGIDFFTAMARQIYDEPDFVRSDPRRQIVKNSGYAKSYGAGVEKFALTAHITNEQAAAFLMRFDQLYPGVRRFQYDVANVVSERIRTEGVAYVKSPMTQRRYVADEGREYALVNHLIQGLAAEIFKLKLLELDAAGLGDYMILPVHDEIVLDVPKDNEPAVVEILRGVMNDDKLLYVPMTASISRGKRWGRKTDVTA